VFVMAELDGYTAPEIAGALELPLNTVYSRLRTARQEFTTAVRRLARERTSP
jgi:RNA polymerase sigma-70 factor, ECF subfamily